MVNFGSAQNPNPEAHNMFLARPLVLPCDEGPLFAPNPVRRASGRGEARRLRPGVAVRSHGAGNALPPCALAPPVLWGICAVSRLLLTASGPLAGVEAAEGVPANLENFEEHAQAVAEHADPGGGAVGPADGDFDGGEAMALGKEEQFGVEAEALDALLLEEDAATLAAKSLEAALGVHERQTERETHEPVEDNTGEFAERRLVDLDEAAVESAGADGNVVSFEGAEELVGFFDRGGEIGVRKEDQPAAGFEHAVADAVAFAVIHAVGDDAQRRHCCAEGFGDGGGAVARAIVHDDNFGRAAGSADVRGDAFDCSGEAGLFVIGRDDDGELGRGVSHRGKARASRGGRREARSGTLRWRAKRSGRRTCG